MAVTDGRSTGEPTSGKYRSVWHRSPPHVCSHIAAVPLYAVSARLAVVICHHAHIYPYHQLRIRNEEQVLERELKGYTEYKQRVRYKVIPFIW